MTNIFERFEQCDGFGYGDYGEYYEIDKLKQFLKQELLTIIEGTVGEENEQKSGDDLAIKKARDGYNIKRTELIQFYKKNGYEVLLKELNIK